MAQAILAAGCFWGIEAAFRKVPGVQATEAGYTGGTTENPSYRDVCTGTTGHAEAVKITFDPSRVSFGKLLEIFWQIHDPTSLNRQGPDVGTQYRSAVFYADSGQRKTAEASAKALAKTLGKPVVTQIAPATEFYRAEEYHQDYVGKNGETACPIPRFVTKG